MVPPGVPRRQHLRGHRQIGEQQLRERGLQVITAGILRVPIRWLRDFRMVGCEGVGEGAAILSNHHLHVPECPAMGLVHAVVASAEEGDRAE